MDRFNLKDILDESTIQTILNFLPYPFLISERRDDQVYNVFVNGKFLDEIGYTLKEIPTLNDWFRLAYPDDDARKAIEEEWKARVEAGLKDSGSVTMQALIRTKHKGDRWYEVKSSISNKMNLVAFVDIDEGKRNEENLKERNEHRDRILSILSHDVRGPISTMHALMSMVAKDQISKDEFAKLVVQINRKVVQTMDFLTTTLSWAKSNFDTIQLKVEPVPLLLLVQELLTFYRELYTHKRLSIDLEIDPSFILRADREVITAVLRNLVSNAIKFSNEGGRIVIRAQRNQAGVVVLEVIDNGIGMDPETIESINSDRSTATAGTRGEKGSGIGLVLCKDLLHHMNSSLQIDSVPRKGTTIRVTINEAP